MLALDVAALLLPIAWLATFSPESVSLRNNFEIVATALFARALFGQAPGVGFIVALALMALGSWLSLPQR